MDAIRAHMQRAAYRLPWQHNQLRANKQKLSAVQTWRSEDIADAFSNQTNQLRKLDTRHGLDATILKFNVLELDVTRGYKT